MDLQRFTPVFRKTIRLYLTGLVLTSSLNGIQAQCTPDMTPPTIVCQENLVIPLGPTLPISFSIAAAISVFDECDPDVELEGFLDGINGPATEFLFGCGDIGPHLLEITAIDDAGNSSACDVIILVVDDMPAIPICVGVYTVLIEPDGQTEVLFNQVVPTIFDNCGSLIIDTTFFIGGVDIGSELVVDCSMVGNQVVQVTITDGNGFSTSCTINLIILDDGGYCEQAILSGTVFYDEIANCDLDLSDPGLGGRQVQVTNLTSGMVQTYFADANGVYTSDPILYSAGMEPELMITLPGTPGYLLPCGDTLTTQVPVGGGLFNLDIPTTLHPDCPLLGVDIATNVLRACQSSLYTFSYTNYSALVVEDVYLEISLEPGLTYVASSIPPSAVNGQVYTFELGDLLPGVQVQETMTVAVACNAQLGQTFCVDAHIYPDVPCDEPDLNWSGASLIAESDCDGSNAILRIRNIGAGDMAGALNYLIVEDMVMYMSEPFQLDESEVLEIEVPANGSTWRIESPQEPGHPGNYQPVAWVEGCEGMNNPGMVNLFALNNTDPFQSVFCLEVTASYDPNDKTGFPRGYDEPNFIRANQDLEYIIRFQNTGNDTAFNVVLTDTLSSFLNLATVRPGTSSHAYQFSADGNGAIRFHFPNILLPDSTTNEPASHGFVKFRVSQSPDLADGVVIENGAYIYFDFNDPVLTNETWHTVEYEFLVSSITTLPVNDQIRLVVAPNPSEGHLEFLLDGHSVHEGRITLYDMLGRAVIAGVFTGQRGAVDAGKLTPGFYRFELAGDGKLLGNGTVVVK